ncbi:MAG: TonB-dependent receptor [Muribaculaceae bacterium]|nr:TonB-dependent receptor [Muribaculaceae bacterium]
MIRKPKFTQFAALSAATLLPMTISAQEHADSIAPAEKGEKRNVMLNASDATKPREIQIGLPSEDVNVYENGLPAVYSSAVHKLPQHWRSDASLGHVDLMNPMESAIKTGNIAYSVDSYSNFGQQEFKGVFNYHTNTFGWQNFDFNVSGGIGDKWLYTASVYQNFDPGYFKIKFTDFSDRTQIYHAGLTRLLDKGRISILYKFSKSNALGSMINNAPFIYVGDGSVKEIPGFALGTTSYAPIGGEFEYMDVMDGKMKKGRWGDFTDNYAHDITAHFDYVFGDNYKLDVNAKYMIAPRADYCDFGGSSIFETTAADQLYKEGESTPYIGLAEGRRTWLHAGKVSNILLTSELSKRFGRHDLRLGLNEWYYYLDYNSSSFQWTGTVSEYPDVLVRHNSDGSTEQFYGFNELSPEYTKGYENKLALYATDNWQVTPKFNLYFGGRLEYYRMSADQIPYPRYAGFHIGDTHQYTDTDGTTHTVTIAPHKVLKNKLNYAATVQGIYNFNRHFGLTADATVATRYPRINEYAGTGPTEEQYKKVTIPLIRGGITYRNDWVDLTSMVTYISKSNNIDQQNVTKPGTTQSKTTLLIYSIKTIGWTTSAELHPFRGFNLHALLTLQKPTYNNYFIKSPFEGVPDLDANGNIVKEIPQVLIELDPSYQLNDKLRFWLSFRYFDKTYAHLTNALFFNGRWETFGGVNWSVNKKFDLGCTVINFLNQKGASGTINGAELLSKEESGKYKNYYMSGSYLRPFTVEFSATFRF